MTFFGDELIDAMLAGCSDSKITVAGTIRPCVLDEFHQEVLNIQGGASQKAKVISAEIRTSAFPDLKQQDEVDVDGIRYTIFERTEMGDGATTRLILRTVES